MNDISNIRVIRWFISCLLVFSSVAFIFNVGIASAIDTGNITIIQASIKDYSIGTSGDQPASISWLEWKFDNVDYQKMTSWRIADPSTSYTLSKNSYYASWACVSGCTGGGDVYYNKLYNENVTWVPYLNSTFSSSVFQISYTPSDFPDTIVELTTNGGSVLASPSVNNPIFVKTNSGNKFDMIYHVEASSETTNFYQLTWTSNSLGKGVNVSVFKNVTNTNVTVIDAFSNFITYDVNGFATIPYYVFIQPANNGIGLNISLASGSYTKLIINSSYVDVPVGETPPVVDPVTGAGIKFDLTDYALGDIANISWLRTASTPFLDTDSIVLIYPDATEEELASSPPDSGYVKALMGSTGTWKVEFRRSSVLYGVSVLASDTATVGADQPSYIFAPAQVAIGKLFNVTYKIGWTITAGASAWIRTYHWDNNIGTWEPTYQSMAATGVKGTEINQSILVTKEGKYLIKLCDVLSGCKASTQTEAFFNGSEVTTNITFSNISTDKTTYSYGETILVKTSVDNFNWSNKQIVVEYYDADEGLTQNQAYIQTQVASFPLYISDLTFSGSGSALLRLVGKNNTGTYILNSTAITLSLVDSQGYGLSISGLPNCTGDTGQIKAIVPAGETANLSISADNSRYNKDYVINGTKIIPYKFLAAGTYYVTLRVNGEVRRNIILTIGDCKPVVTETPFSGVAQASQVASLLTTGAFWSLIITAGLMIWIAYRTGSGFATGTLGMLSMGIFTLLTWLPAWIFFSVLIVAALLLAGSLVMKQSPYGKEKGGV